MSAADVTHYLGDECPGGHHDDLPWDQPPPPFERGQYLLVTQIEKDTPQRVLRVLGVEWRLTVEPLTGEEPTDG